LIFLTRHRSPTNPALTPSRKYRHVAYIGEIDESHEVCRCLDPIILLGRQISKRGSEERASKAIADSVHLTLAGRSPGRVLEARFQWSHARDLKPEPEDLVKIEAKLKWGLPDDTAPEAEPKQPGGG
jgi:hypothetical protein